MDLIGGQFQQFQRFHCEAAMYGRENSGPEDCDAAPRNLLPGWNERSGWSVLINGRPVEGRLTVVNPDDEENRFLSFAGRTRRADGRTACKHLATALTAWRPDWIETLGLGNPDGGSGALETTILVVLSIATAITATWAWRACARLMSMNA